MSRLRKPIAIGILLATVGPAAATASAAVIASAPAYSVQPAADVGATIPMDAKAMRATTTDSDTIPMDAKINLRDVRSTIPMD